MGAAVRVWHARESGRNVGGWESREEERGGTKGALCLQKYLHICLFVCLFVCLSVIAGIPTANDPSDVTCEECTHWRACILFSEAQMTKKKMNQPQMDMKRQPHN